MAESVQNVQVAAGAFVGTAPAATVAPALPASGPHVADPAAPWKDVGYVTEDGITSTRGRETENFGAWQSPSPIAVLVTAITDVFGFAIREWNQNAFDFVYGRGALTGAKKWEPAKLNIPSVALLLQWDWLTYASQLWIPRGTLQGDTETTLARTAPSDLAIEFISTPSSTEPIWTFETSHPAFATAPTIFAVEGEDGPEIKSKSKAA